MGEGEFKKRFGLKRGVFVYYEAVDTGINGISEEGRGYQFCVKQGIFAADHYDGNSHVVK